MALLPERCKVVTATVDNAAGEIDTIYQACGFDYVGVMRSGGRALVSISGKRVSERQAGRLAGTRGARALAQLGLDAMTTPGPGRYFAFRGSRKERQQLRAAIARADKAVPETRFYLRMRCRHGFSDQRGVDLPQRPGAYGP